MPELAFVHVGLGKCASTFLQNAWNQDAGYVEANTALHASTSRKYAAEGKALPRKIQGINFNDLSGGIVYSSSEAYTYGYDLDVTVADQVMERIYGYSAHVISSIVEPKHILVIVRDPLRWIRSAYVQAIKQGGSETFEEFLSDYRSWIEQSLNLGHLLVEFGKFFPSIVVLSADDLRDRPDFFWSQYEKKLDVRRPAEPKVDKLRANESMNGPDLRRLAAANRFRRMMRDFLKSPGDYPSANPVTTAEFGMMTERLPEIDYYSTFLARRVFEFGSSEQVSDADIFLRDFDIESGEVDASLKDRLCHGFLLPVEACDSISDEAKSQYERSLGK